MILQNKSYEDRCQIFQDDDEAVRASLDQLHNEDTRNQLSLVAKYVQSFASCCARSIDEERAIPDLNNEGPAVSEPLEHVRTWTEWLLQMYDSICATASSAFKAVKSAVGSAVNSLKLLQSTMESMSSLLHSTYLILERLLRAMLAIFPAYNTHAHHS